MSGSSCTARRGNDMTDHTTKKERTILVSFTFPADMEVSEFMDTIAGCICDMDYEFAENVDMKVIVP